MTIRPSLTAVTVTLVILAAGCGSGDDNAAADVPTPEEMQSTPLAEFMGWNQDPADFEDEWQAQEREVQELIVACMAEEGFEYQPEIYDAVDSFDPWSDSEFEPGTREWVENYGYGILTFFEEEQSTVGLETAEFVDPNAEYLATLGEDGMDAYYAALHGDQPELDSSLSEEEMEELWANFVPSGCYAEAEAEVYGSDFFGPGGSEEPGEMEEFWSLQEDLWERLEGDPRIAEASADWSACMADAGHTFADQEELFDSLTDRSDEFYGSLTYPGDDLSQADYEEMTAEEMDALFSQPPTYDVELLEELQAFEIDLAVTDFDCSAPTMRVRLEVQRELEAEFIDDHRELLEQVRDELP